MKYCLLIAIGMTIILTANSALAEIYVSDQQSLIVSTKSNIRPMSFGSVLISSENMPAGFSISGIVQSPAFPDIIIHICDEPNLNNLLNGRLYTCINSPKQKGQFFLKGKTYSTNKHYLVFDNSYSNFTKKAVSADISIEVTISPEEKADLIQKLDGVQKNIYRVFDVPKFNLSLTSCGAVNAFSADKDGSITICSETFMDALSDHKTGMLAGIIMHELGHTLLNLWGMPDYNNEKTADEFAVVFLLMNHGDAMLKDWISFFEDNQNLIGEVQGIAATGDQHPLSIQRIAAIRAIIANPFPTIHRWNNILYPHMTNEYLEAVINTPNQFLGPDLELAKKELENRGIK